jgi:mannose-1-phosphate guanylyltransferase
MSTSCRTVILAGGSGQRLSRLTGGIPKQFWKYDGKHTLLVDTLDRVGRLSSPAETLIVVNRSHQAHLDRLPELARRGTILPQPGDRGTAAGVLLALIDVLEYAPDAIVLITPSDHGVMSAEQFHGAVADAHAAIDAGAHDVVLFGAEPCEASQDYGWITAIRRPSASSSFARVVRFVEKPDRAEAERLFASGAVWNTMVLVARAAALFDLCAAHAHDLTSLFGRTRGMAPAARERWLHDRYADLPRTDFSRDVLARARGLALAMFPASMGWSDLGTPERLTRWLAWQSVA